MSHNTSTNYPIGVYTFRDIVERNHFYIDKTKGLYEIANRFKYVFLSRPRRFGKSLLVDTLKCYFEGQKELFKGLTIEDLEKEWVQRPVLRFDMSRAKSKSVGTVEMVLNEMLCEYENVYGKPTTDTTLGGRLEYQIKAANVKTGQKVVLLIDEYDSPMLEVFHQKEALAAVRDILRNFYGPIKTCDAYLRFGFITGITKFSQMGIFSGINNLKDISMLDDYSDICGISKEELLSQCQTHIESLSYALGLNYPDTVNELTKNYDGYHFSINSKDVFNPFSLINAFNDKQLGRYWYESATPTFLFEQMKKSTLNIANMDSVELRLSSFNVAPDRTDIDASIPYLYQSGYLTIKSYDKKFNLYCLGFPNNEVKYGFLEEFMPSVTGMQGADRDATIVEIARALYRGDVVSVMHRLQAMLARLPYFYGGTHEVDFQSAMYIVFSMLTEQYVKAETPFALGRPDAIIETADYVYIFEYKINSTPDAALTQIEEKQYAAPYAADKRTIIKVGINFSSEKKNIDSWKVVTV